MAKAKLLVAVDVFNPLHRSVKGALETVKMIASQGRFQTQAIGVLGPADIAWPTSFTPEWQAHFTSRGREHLEKGLKKLAFKSELKPQLLIERAYSKRISAQQLALQAKELSAEILVLFTHVNKSPDFAPMGGFAETVVSTSHIPVLLVNAKAKPIKKIKTALFATDFSPEAKSSFLKAVKLAKALNFKIKLFHTLYQPTYALAFAGTTFVPAASQIGTIFEAQERDAKKQGAAWAQEAEAQGVEVEVIIENGFIEPAQEVIKWAHGKGKKSVDMIIVAPQVSHLASLVLGSTSKAILRKSVKPVLLIHGDSQKEGTKNAAQKVSRNRDNQTYRDSL